MSDNKLILQNTKLFPLASRILHSKHLIDPFPNEQMLNAILPDQIIKIMVSEIVPGKMIFQEIVVKIAVVNGNDLSGDVLTESSIAHKHGVYVGSYLKFSKDNVIEIVEGGK